MALNLYNPSCTEPSVAEIIEVVSKVTGIPSNRICSETRKREVYQARCIVAKLAYDITTKSYPQVGRAMGNRDHTTIMHARQRAGQFMEQSQDFRDKFETCENILNAKAN